MLLKTFNTISNY